MATGKRYYWLKLKRDFILGDEVEYMMSQPNGAQFVVIYLMLCFAAINSNGALLRTLGEMIIPFDIPRIQRECRYFDESTIEKALKLYSKIGLIYEDQNGAYIIANFDNMVGSTTDYADQKRRQRASVDNGVDNGVDNVHTESESRNQSPEFRDQKSESRGREQRRSASASSTSTAPNERKADRDADADLLHSLSGFLYSHKIKLSTPDVERLLRDGFDLDSIFWMVERTEDAHPVNFTSYFNTVCEDKREKCATTINAIREAECNSDAFREMFDKHVIYWREEYDKYRNRKGS